MDRDVLDARLDRGTALLTTYLTRDPGGTMDANSLRSILGHNVSDDDVISALGDMLLAAETVMLSYSVKTDIPPIDALREIAIHREQRRGE
ncbi:hypothetical protein [Mycolicibacter arupensis]|uniref:Uncharacterized protein n=1 Tax=Mycolicibacter arupensis TaxID=342002 RepID=A0A5C7XVA9_9MYCO|nr:hypothetical protein [Mycolicibacter arupensis]TXI53391.1 MAG: hypothetical protein E6Q54_16565 [Mycolicibacter arupensis]